MPCGADSLILPFGGNGVEPDGIDRIGVLMEFDPVFLLEAAENNIKFTAFYFREIGGNQYK